MRLKRLARLGGSVNQEARPSSPQTPSEDQSQSRSSTPHVPPSSASRLLSQAIPSPARAPSPAAKPTVSPASKPTPAPATPKATPSPKPSAKPSGSRSSSFSAPVASKPRLAASSPVKPTQSYEDWESQAVGKVFNVTLDVSSRPPFRQLTAESGGREVGLEEDMVEGSSRGDAGGERRYVCTARRCSSELTSSRHAKGFPRLTRPSPYRPTVPGPDCHGVKVAC